VLRYLLAILAGVVLSYAVQTATAQNALVYLADGAQIEEHGGLAARLYGYNGPRLTLDAGDIDGVRNIQGGKWDPQRPSMLNLDVGAGSEEHPGQLLLGADVTRSIVFHVRKPGEPPRKMLEISPKGITFFIKPRVVDR
jgi:hypothetical protein